MATSPGRLRCHFVAVPYASEETAHRVLDETAHAVGRLRSSRWDATTLCYEADFDGGQPEAGCVERFATRVEEDGFILKGQVEWLPPAPG